APVAISRSPRRSGGIAERTVSRWPRRSRQRSPAAEPRAWSTGRGTPPSPVSVTTSTLSPRARSASPRNAATRPSPAGSTLGDEIARRSVRKRRVRSKTSGGSRLSITSASVTRRSADLTLREQEIPEPAPGGPEMAAAGGRDALRRQQPGEQALPAAEPVALAEGEQEGRVGRGRTGRPSIALEPDPEPVDVLARESSFRMPGARAAGRFDLFEDLVLAQVRGDQREAVDLARAVAGVERGPEAAERDAGEPDRLDPSRAGRGDHIVVEPIDDRGLPVIAEMEVDGHGGAGRAARAQAPDEAVRREVLRPVADAGQEDDQAARPRLALERDRRHGHGGRPRARGAAAAEGGESDESRRGEESEARSRERSLELHGSGPPGSCDRVRPLQRESLPMPSPIRISLKTARDYLLGHLGLRAVVDPPGAEGTRAVLRRLRAIQLDPLDPIGTNADLVVQARVDGVRRGEIFTHLLPGHAFEHFAKERCLLPASAFPYYRDRLAE